MNDFLNKINPYSFTGSAILIGLILIQELDAAEQSSIGNWLQLIGLTIQTYASQVAVVQQDNSTDNAKQKDAANFDTLCDVIDKMKNQLETWKEDTKT